MSVCGCFRALVPGPPCPVLGSHASFSTPSGHLASSLAFPWAWVHPRSLSAEMTRPPKATRKWTCPAAPLAAGCTGPPCVRTRLAQLRRHFSPVESPWLSLGPWGASLRAQRPLPGAQPEDGAPVRGDASGVTPKPTQDTCVQPAVMCPLSRWGNQGTGKLCRPAGRVRLEYRRRPRGPWSDLLTLCLSCRGRQLRFVLGVEADDCLLVTGKLGHGLAC